MYKDIFESIRNEAEKRNLRERTIQLYCSDVSYFLRWIVNGKSLVPSYSLNFMTLYSVMESVKSEISVILTF